LFLENTQELGLQLQRDIADLIEKDCALVRKLEPADAMRNSAREGALFMTKQFTFSMRSAISRWSCNPSSCVFSRNKNSNA